MSGAMLTEEERSVMSENKLLSRYFSLVIRYGLYSSEDHLKFYLNYIFKNVSFENKKMLDIGGGTGLFSFYAACMGSDEVICIEPGSSGFSQGAIEKFKKLQSDIEIPDLVKFEPTTIQNFISDDKKFDLILLHHSINHLDEEACVNLQHDGNAIKNYQKIFRKLSDSARSGAKLIIVDCSRYNFFAQFNIRNPFVPMIEWHKHQPPEYWAKLLSGVGFYNPEIRWTSFDPLYSIGRILFGNKVASYFTISHFCLTMEKI